MNKFLLSLALCLVLLPSVFAKVIVVSDIDDTIKKANSANGGIGQAYHFLRKKVYLEMRDLFVELERSYEDLGEEVEFYYVSAAPDVLFNQQKWLAKHKFPQGYDRLRVPGDGNTYTYKTKVIGDILAKMSPSDTFYFFGDNSSKDAIVYSELTEKMGLVNSYIFIRDVSSEATDWSSALPIHRLEGVNYFFSEAELVDHPTLFFISEELRAKIAKAYAERELIPEYTYKTLVSRMKDSFNCSFFDFDCKVTAENEAAKMWNDYHSRF